MRTGPNRLKLLSLRPLPRQTTLVLCLGEMFLALALAITFLAASNHQVHFAILFFLCGLAAWTFAEYTIHRFVLHAVFTHQHGMHHARPRDPIDRILWQIWIGFAVVYLAMGGTVLAGVLVAYACYLAI